MHFFLLPVVSTNVAHELPALSLSAAISGDVHVLDFDFDLNTRDIMCLC